MNNIEGEEHRILVFLLDHQVFQMLQLFFEIEL
jgi:hypothetical protein